MMLVEKIKKDVEKKLSKDPKRLKHTFGVYEVALKLAEVYHVSKEDASIAALFHDYMKVDDMKTQMALLSDNDIQHYQQAKVMYHALSAAKCLEKKYKIKNKDLINAVRYHVWGHKQMSLLGKIIFVSDYCEPNRDFLDTTYIYQLAVQNIDEAVLYCMKLTLDDVLRKKKMPHEDQIEAYHKMKEETDGKTTSNH